jgi:hypothetical protein
MRSFPAPDGFSPALFEKAHFQPNLRPLKQDVVGDIGKVLTCPRKTLPFETGVLS